MSNPPTRRNEPSEHGKGHTKSWDNGDAPEGAGNTAPRLDPHHLDERKC